jgi:hypothetical protein
VVSSGTESASVGKGGNEDTSTVVEVAIWRCDNKKKKRKAEQRELTVRCCLQSAAKPSEAELGLAVGG